MIVADIDDVVPAPYEGRRTDRGGIEKKRGKGKALSRSRPEKGDRGFYFGVSFNSRLVGGVSGLTEPVPLSVRT